MTINIEEVLERAFEQAFLRALDQTVQAKAEELFKRMLSAGSPLSKKLEEKIEQGFERFLEEGIRWEKKKAGFKK
ncbi:MAG TPA: hypothetical protein VE999_11130 [Gemmataceae bacterium]|nr:hypothetical protein [Gemmataceae bacterium]